MVLIAPDIRGGAVPYPVAVEILPGSVVNSELCACVYAGGVAGEVVIGSKLQVANEIISCHRRVVSVPCTRGVIAMPTVVRSI